MSTNPFRQPRPQAGIVLKQRVWNATGQGKDASLGTVTLLADEAFLWIGDVANVPLSWVEAVEPLGPGFRLVWNNNLTGQQEVATFCIRTFFGYDEIRREKLTEELVRLAEDARQESASAVADSDPVYEICGPPAEHQMDLMSLINIFFYLVRRTNRRRTASPPLIGIPFWHHGDNQ